MKNRHETPLSTLVRDYRYSLGPVCIPDRGNLFRKQIVLGSCWALYEGSVMGGAELKAKAKVTELLQAPDGTEPVPLRNDRFPMIIHSHTRKTTQS